MRISQLQYIVLFTITLKLIDFGGECFQHGVVDEITLSEERVNLIVFDVILLQQSQKLSPVLRRVNNQFFNFFIFKAIIRDIE